MFRSVYIVLILLISTYHCKLPEKVLCANEECNKPISKARTLLNYNSPEPEFISFKSKSDALIFMKSVESKPDTWYASIDGQNGFVNPRFLKELRILEPTTHIVQTNDVMSKKLDVQPDRVQKPHEVFEGTTIFTTESSTSANTEYPNVDYDQNKSPVGNENIENILNQKNVEPAVKPDQSPEDNASTSVNTLPTEENSMPNVINDPSVSNLEKPTNENVSMETNAEPEKTNLIDQTLSDAASNDLHDQTLVLKTNNDNNLNMLPTEPPMVNENANNNNVINSNPEMSDNEVDNSNISNSNGEKSTEENNNEQQNISEKDQSKSLENTPAEVSVENIMPPSEINPNKIETIPETIIPVDTVPKVSESTEQNTLTITDNVPDTDQLQNTVLPEKSLPNEPVPVEVPPTSEPEPLVTETPTDSPKVPENIPEIVTFVPEVTNTIPVQFDNIALSIPPMENKQPETIPTIPEVPVFQPVISVPDYSSSENIQNSQYTTETIAAIEASTESYVSDDNIKSLEVDTQTTIPEMMPSASESSDMNSQSTESLINEIFSESTTQSPVEDTSEGFFSNIYTTIADMMPPSTEQPPPENVFNPDYIPKTENEPEQTDSFSFMNYLWATYTSVMGAKDESSALFPVVGETCYTDEYCDGTGNNHNRFLTFLLTTASTILLFTLGYYYIDNKRQDSRLIGNINNLQRELLFATKECEILKEELTTTKTKLAGIEDNSFGMDDMVQSLKEEINDLKEQNERLRNSLDDNEKLLRVSENTASELQNTLGEVENTLSELMEERTNSEDQIAELNEKIRAFEEELISVSRDRDNFQLKYVSTENALEEFNKQKQVLEELNKKIAEANNVIELQKHEIVALKDTIKELKVGSSSNVDVNSLIDHTEIKAKLAKALEEKNSYMDKYELAHKEQTRLAEELKATQESYQTASQQATESVTRLEVLGKYFQERESELMKELSTKESLYLSKRGESASTVEKMELLQQEIQRYKEKCDALTLSLAEQESSKRATVSELEARAHQAWLEARAARRDADAAAADATALRRKLVAVSHADGAASPHRHVASPLEAEGAPVPPLPLAFFPPPLLPPLARPPPLGRLPSPPRFGDRRFSPESRYSPETRYSPESRYSPQSRYSPDRARYSPDRARHSPDRARHSPDRARYSPESRYSPRRRSPYSSRSRRRSIDRYSERGSRRNGDTETEYNSDSPSRRPRRRYSRRSDSSGSGCSSESEK